MSPPKGGWREKIITSQRTPEGCLVNTQTLIKIFQVVSEVFTQKPVALVGTGGSVLNEPPPPKGGWWEKINTSQITPQECMKAHMIQKYWFC